MNLRPAGSHFPVQPSGTVFVRELHAGFLEVGLNLAGLGHRRNFEVGVGGQRHVHFPGIVSDIDILTRGLGITDLDVTFGVGDVQASADVFDFDVLVVCREFGGAAHIRDFDLLGIQLQTASHSHESNVGLLRMVRAVPATLRKRTGPKKSPSIPAFPFTSDTSISLPRPARLRFPATPVMRASPFDIFALTSDPELWISRSPLPLLAVTGPAISEILMFP